MDEIIIDDKRYISSKRAAHLTGYAKDYVGQLCREGRVPARLVGRAWYVLETAIQDHRFGAAEVKEEREPREFVTKPILPEQWDAARYSIPEPPLLPELKKETREPVEEPQTGPLEESVIMPIEESWEDLFSSTQEEGGHKEVKRVAQPVMVMNEIQPKVSPVEISVPSVRVNRRKGNGSRVLTLVLMVVATLSASLAALNSGFFDAYLTSSSRATVITGYSIYQKAK